MQCPNCGFDSPPEMRFCGQCGIRLAWVCPACSFANPPAFRFCGQCGTQRSEVPAPVQPPPAQPPLEVVASPHPAPVQLEGERRLATVILADVTGSTDLMERIGTEAWVEVMNRVFHILESEVYRFGGEVDQFRGDGLVAFFGATAAHEDDPERAVLAGLAMQRALEPYAAELVERESIDLRLRVGVNTGEVIVASVGDRRQYSEDTVMGEAVALAARMETAAEPGTVLVSEHTYRLVEPRFEWEPLGEITVKGVSHPLTVYRPLAPRADAGRPYRLQAFVLSVPLIGREAEFSLIKNRVEGLRAGRGGIVMVMGDEGMGKSFLVTQVRQHLVRDCALLAEACATGPRTDALSPLGLTWLQGRCRSYGQSSP
jgi:class 3 adenylate cyclase